MTWWTVWAVVVCVGNACSDREKYMSMMSEDEALVVELGCRATPFEPNYT